jgi:hypothetical protein
MEWKTSKDLKKELHKYVLQTADELVVELRERKETWRIKSKQEDLCMK